MLRHIVVIRDSVTSLRSSGPATLNWLFLVENVVIVILIVFYFFYFNRLLGVVVSWYLRHRYWKSSNAYIEIGGISFSLLGGRINFSDVRYISRNQSFRVVRGYIVWKYWLRRVRSEDQFPGDAKLPCRIQVSFHGAELFLYNRTPHYDEILSKLGVLDPILSWTGGHEPSLSSEELLGGEKNSTLSSDLTKKSDSETSDLTTAATPTPSPSRSAVAEEKEDGTDWWREAMPVEIRCQTGSIIMGNPSTPSILIAGFARVDGSYSASKSRSSLDRYKESYRMVFTQPKIVFRTNPDYTGPLGEHGAGVVEKLETSPGFFLGEFLHRPAQHASLNSFREILRRIPHLPKAKRREAERAKLAKVGADAPNGTNDAWAGLPRYQSLADKASETTHTPMHRIEYAKVTTLLASPALEMNYYCDVAGKVPAEARMVTGFAGLETSDIGNGDLSPEWGIDVVVRGGEVTYGPWADRQRAEIQQAFVPATFFNVVPTPRREVGQERMHVALKIFVEFTDGATLRIPTREPSKDWKYDSVDSSPLAGATIRPYGWLDVGLGPNSTLSVVMPMVATAVGYDQQVELHLDEMTVTSSVNYAPFVRAQTCRVFIGMPAPLSWDESRTWTINTSLAKPDISVLRDHITLLTDVAKDWTSGPPGDYDRFVPFKYALSFTVSDYALRLCVNDHNIINNPTTLEDNALLIAKGPKLVAHATIPSDKYRMDRSVIPFGVIFTDLALLMSLPDWHTHSAFLTERTSMFATAPELTIDGSYRFYATAHPDHVERLDLNVNCHDVIFKTMGWVVRYLFNLRDNYFGTFTHFVTLEEYRHRHERNLQGDPLEQKWRPGKVDVFEVALKLNLRNGVMLLPESLYDCQSAIALVLPQLQVDLRNHDFFMEMAVNADPLRILEMSDSEAVLASTKFAALLEQPDSIRVQGFEITANRLFGPQPRTATYICIWSIAVGSIIGSIPPSFLQAFARAGTSVGVNFVDADNSLPPDFTIILDPDATFVTVDLRSVDLAVRGLTTAIQLDIPDGIAIKFDDLSTAPFLKHIDVDVPTLTVRALAPLFGRAAPWMEVASIDADLTITLGLSETKWKEKAHTQRSFIAAQDQLTKRCPFLYGQGRGVSSHIGSLYLPALDYPTRLSDQAEMPAASTKSPLRFESATAEEDDSDLESQSDASTLESGHTSDTTDDDDDYLDRQFGRDIERGDRFSAYGAILRLCKRAPESAYLDRPTFSRLPAAASASSDDGGDNCGVMQPLLRAKTRLEHFGAPEQDRPGTKTAIDLRCRRTVRVVLTPIAVQVGADVLEGVRHDHDFEQVLDDLYDEYVSSQKAAPTVRHSDLEFKATIPSVRVEAIQDVLRPEDAISIRTRSRDEIVDEGSNSTVLCTVQAALDDVLVSFRQVDDRFGGSENPEGPTPAIAVRSQFSGSAAKTRLQVFHPEQSATYPARKSHVLPSTSRVTRTRPTALDLTLGQCSAEIDCSTDRAVATLRGGDTRLEFVDEAAELIIGTVWSWRVVHDVAGPLTERALQRKLLSRRLVWAIAEASQRRSIASFPTFLNRASYLVSRASLRADDGWKTLHHLRHCRRLARDEVDRLMSEQRQWPSSQQLYKDVVDLVSRWQTWTIDADDLSRSKFLTTLFDSAPPYLPPLRGASAYPPVTAAPSWDKPMALTWSSGQLEALFWSGTRSRNRLFVGPLNGFLASTGRKSEQQVVRLRGKVTLHFLEADVDRDLMILVRHIVGVRHTFERKLQAFAEQLAAAKAATKEADDSDSIVTQNDWLSVLPALATDISFSLQRVSIKALADDLEAHGLIDDFALTLSGSLRAIDSRSTQMPVQTFDSTASFLMGRIAFGAREIQDERAELLFSSELDQLSLVKKTSGSFSRRTIPSDSNPACEIAFSIQAAHIKVPRDAVRSYDFIDKWKTSALPEYDSLLTELRLSLEGVTSTPPTATATSRRVTRDRHLGAASLPPSLAQTFLEKAKFGAQIAIPLFVLEVQAIPTLKVAYAVQTVSLQASSPKGDGRHRNPEAMLGELELQMQVGAQSVRFLPVLEVGKGVSPLPAETAFALPVVRAKAYLDGVPCRSARVETEVGPVSIKLTVGIIDSILTMQQHFGSDIDELLAMLRSKRLAVDESDAPGVLSGSAVRAAGPTAQSSSSPNSRPSSSWDGTIAFRGFKLGVEGPQATQWIEAELIEGHATCPRTTTTRRDPRWRANVKNLSISLEQRQTVDAPSSGPSDLRYRLAFFRLDLEAKNAVIDLPSLPAASSYGDEQTPHLHLQIPRVHAVAQPAAVEALGDLVDYFKQEIEARRHLREAELKALGDRVAKTIDDIGVGTGTNPAGDGDTGTGAAMPVARSWLASCVVSLEMESIGIAIPLGDEGIPVPDVAMLRRPKSANARPAFLSTVSAIKFGAQKGSAGFARVAEFGLQFVPEFDQLKEEDFEGATHQSRNRLLLPDMHSTVRAPTGKPVIVNSRVSGLEIDLEPSIVAYTFALIDVYRLSHERFAKYALQPDAADRPSTPPSTPLGASLGPSRQATMSSSSSSLALRVQASFTFASGAIRLHSGKARSPSSASKVPATPASPRRYNPRPAVHRSAHSLHDVSPFQRTQANRGAAAESEDPPDVFKLPRVSMWAQTQESTGADLTNLHVDIRIHASKNTLYPSLIPFISAVVGELKKRASKSRPADAIARVDPSQTEDEATSTSAFAPALPDAPESLRRFRLGISLKVDESSLEMSCLPAADVTARLNWQSGGFLLTLSPDSKTVEFAVTVDGISAGLRHSYSPEDCLSAEAKGIAASIAFRSASGLPALDSTGVISAIIAIPDVSANMNFRHLQVWMCLKAVWLDRMDLNLSAAEGDKAAIAPTSPPVVAAHSTSSNLTTIVFIEITKFEITCDLGHSIARFKLSAENLDGRLRWVPRHSRVFSFALKTLELVGEGKAGGSVAVDGIIFSTRLGDEASKAEGGGASDLLQIQIGIGEILASFEYEFKKILALQSDPVAVVVSDDWSRATTASAELDLAFQVKMGSFNIIATTSTIPTLIGISHRVTALIGEKSAEADATLAGAGLPPRPATVRRATNVVSAVASKLSLDDDATECSIRIVNRLKLELVRIRIAVFPDSFNEGEVFRVDAGGTVRAELTRGIDESQTIHRDLELFLGFFSIRKVNHRKLPQKQEREYDVPAWFDLFRTSTERNIFNIGLSQVSMVSTQAAGSHRLRHKFAMTFGGQVNIALNYALLRTLGSLAAAYQAKMDRVHAEGDALPDSSAPVEEAPLTDAEARLAQEPAPPSPQLESDTRTQTITNLPASESSIVKMRPTPLVQAATGDHRALEFEAIEMKVHQPQLNLLGEATPPLEWLGLQRDRFPAWVHTAVSGPLEEILILLSATYHNQLAKQKLVGTRGKLASTISSDSKRAESKHPGGGAGGA